MGKLIFLFLLCFSLDGYSQASQFWAALGSSTPMDSILVNVDTTQTESTAKNMTGDPHLNVLSVTGGNNNTITVTSGSTAAWKSYGGCGCSAYPNNGYLSSTIFTPQMRKECWFSYNGGGANNDQYNSSFPKFVATGLLPGHTYDVIISGTLDGSSFNFNSSTEYRVSGAALTGPETINCKSNVSTVTTTLTGLQPDGSGQMKIYVNAASGQDMGVVTGFKIVQRS